MSERPLYAAHFSEESLARYVAWLLNDESLANNPEFCTFCSDMRNKGHHSDDTAKAWSMQNERGREANSQGTT